MNIALDPKFSRVLLLITNRCNLTCKHCYVSSSPSGEFGLSKKRIIEFIDEVNCKLGNVLINISGGEPLSRKNDCIEILEYASQKLKVRLLTNATLITPIIAGKLTDLGITIRISIDGGDNFTHNFIRGEGAFEKTLVGIKNLKEAGFPFSSLQIYSTITNESVDQIPKIIEFAENTGIHYIKFETLAMDGRALRFWKSNIDGNSNESYLKFFKEHFFNNYGNSWHIEDLTPQDMSFTCLTTYYNGETFPFTYTNSIDKQIGYLGNINKESLESILSKKQLSEAIFKKFMLIATGPKRSLQAYWLTKK